MAYPAMDARRIMGHKSTEIETFSAIGAGTP